jgi:hypothetical protein
MTEQTWTPQLVRQLLPDVPVQFEDGSTGNAMTSGRLNQFLTLRQVDGVVAGTLLGEVTDVTVARCLNENRPVKI